MLDIDAEKANASFVFAARWRDSRIGENQQGLPHP